MGTNGTNGTAGLFEEPVTCADALKLVEQVYADAKAMMERAAELADVVRKLADAKGEPIPAPMTVTKHHPIKDVLTYFDAKHRSELNEPAKILGGRDATIVQGLLKTYTEERICELIDLFFQSRDDFTVNRTGFTVAAFSSRLPSLISSSRLPARAAGVTARTQGNQQQATQAADLIRQNYGGR